MAVVDASTLSDAGTLASASTPGPTEVVHRPDAGLARGLVEAPPWMFYILTGVIVVAAGLYAAARLGWLQRVRKRK
jgi:hypothetical protein